MVWLHTDNKVDRIETILKYSHYTDYFDVVAISAALHSGKEDSKIFQYVLESIGVDAAECVFIDNTAKNLIVPARMGMKTILFDDEKRDLGSFVQNLSTVLADEKGEK